MMGKELLRNLFKIKRECENLISKKATSLCKTLKIIFENNNFNLDIMNKLFKERFDSLDLDYFDYYGKKIDEESNFKFRFENNENRLNFITNWIMEIRNEKNKNYKKRVKFIQNKNI